ncbi:MAG: Sec-independent protein translocase protein TatB [Rhodomicrobiaceae bacterium]
MFDIAWSELLIVLIVAILVIGPKELPALLRTLGQMLGKLRRSADEFRRQFDEAVREAGGEDLQREMRALQQHNPLNQIKNQIEEAARDAQTSLSTDTPTPAKTEPAADEPGVPLPLPPHTDGEAASTASTGTATPKAAEDMPAAPPSAAPAPKDGAAANGAGHEQRVNGEHRPAG